MPFPSSARFIVVMLLAAGLSTSLSRGAVVFTDSDFLLADWTQFQSVGNGALAASQGLVGGNPDEYRRVDHLSFSFNFVAFHLNTAAVHDPSAQEIATIDFAIDQIALFNHAGIGVGVAPAVFQNGVGYLTLNGLLINSDVFNWVSLSASGFTALDFRTFANPNAHPDFSSAGAPMTFGFATINDNGGAIRSRAAGFDNWNLTLNPVVPEPASAALLLIAAIGPALRRRVSISADLKP